MRKVRVEMTVVLNDDRDVAEIKKWEHHIDYAINMDDYPEIHHIENVVVTINSVATNIIWDLDEEDIEDGVELPTEVEIPSDIDDDDVADYLADKFGFCVIGFNVE